MDSIVWPAVIVAGIIMLFIPSGAVFALSIVISLPLTIITLVDGTLHVVVYSDPWNRNKFGEERVTCRKHTILVIPMLSIINRLLGIRKYIKPSGYE